MHEHIIIECDYTSLVGLFVLHRSEVLMDMLAAVQIANISNLVWFLLVWFIPRLSLLGMGLLFFIVS